MEEKSAEITQKLSEISDPATIFRELTARASSIKSSYDSNDFDAVLEKGSGIQELVDEPVQKFLSASLGFTLSACAELIMQIGKSGVDTKSAEKIFEETADSFNDNDFTKTSEGIGKLNDEISSLKEKQVEAAEKLVEEIKSLVESLNEIEAGTGEVESILRIAESSFKSENYIDVSDQAEKAREAADKSRDARVEEVKGILEKTRGVIDEAKTIGVDVADIEQMYTDAEKALNSGDYKKCAELSAQAEQTAVEKEEAQIAKVMEIQKRRETAASETSAEPAAEEPAAEEPAEAEADEAGDEEPAVETAADEGDVSEEPEAAAEMEMEMEIDSSTEETGDAGLDSGGEDISHTESVSLGDTEDEGAEEPAGDAQPQAVLCEDCGNITRYIEQYSRYWCDTCRKYL